MTEQMSVNMIIRKFPLSHLQQNLDRRTQWANGKMLKYQNNLFYILMQVKDT